MNRVILAVCLLACGALFALHPSSSVADDFVQTPDDAPFARQVRWAGRRIRPPQDSPSSEIPEPDGWFNIQEARGWPEA